MSNQPERPWLVPDPWEVDEPDPRLERIRANGRRYMAKKRRQAEEARWRDSVGSLHSLACTDPTRHKGTRKCSPIPVFR